MLSEVIHSRHSYSAVPRAGQQIDQWSVHSGPLVLGATSLKYQRLQQIGDQPVSTWNQSKADYSIFKFYHITLLVNTDIISEN